MDYHNTFTDTRAGRVLLTKDRSAAAAFASSGGCVIGVCPEEELRTIDFPEAYVLAAEEEPLSQAFIEKAACHFYRRPFTVAVTDRLTVRESIGDDYRAIFSLLQRCADGRIFADGFSLEEIDTEEKFLQYVNACYHFFGFGVWTVLLKDLKKGDDNAPAEKEESGSGSGGRSRASSVIGWCGLYPKKDAEEEGYHVELGYAIDPAFQRKGYAYEACRAILAYAEKETGLRQVLLKTDADNAASGALAKKLGFTLQESGDIQPQCVKDDDGMADPADQKCAGNPETYLLKLPEGMNGEEAL